MPKKTKKELVKKVKGDFDFRRKETIQNMVANGGNLEGAMKATKKYSLAYIHSHKITKTKKFKTAIKPILKRLIAERDKAVKAMDGKRKSAKYRDLIDATDKLTKNIQLLSGGKTENNELTIKWDK